MSEKKEKNRLATFWKARRRKKHCCRNCHFLAREDVFENGQRYTNTWTEKEREKGQIIRPEELASAPKCRKGFWDTGIDPELNTRLEEVIDKDRKKDGCFIEHHDGMSFDGATELLRSRNELHAKRDENRRHKNNFFIAATSLCISIIALIFSIIGFEDVEKFVKQFLSG